MEGGRPGKSMTQTDYIMRIIEEWAVFFWSIVFNKKMRYYDLALEKIEEAYSAGYSIQIHT